MKKRIRLLVLFIIFSFFTCCFASYENRCLLTGKLLNDPIIAGSSLDHSKVIGQSTPTSQQEIKNIQLKIWVTESEKAGRADSGCHLTNNQPYELLVTLPATLTNVYKLTKAAKDHSISLLHTIIEEDDHYEQYTLP